MKKTILFIFTSILMSLHIKAQSLPANTCGVVYTYDAAGSRTERKYVCNNGLSSMNSNNELLFKNVQKVDKLFPNPTKGTFTVTFSKPLEQANIFLMDISGRILQKSVRSGSQLEFDISNQPPGMYLLRVEDGTNIITQKVVKL